MKKFSSARKEFSENEDFTKKKLSFGRNIRFASYVLEKLLSLNSKFQTRNLRKSNCFLPLNNPQKLLNFLDFKRETLVAVDLLRYWMIIKYWLFVRFDTLGQENVETELPLATINSLEPPTVDNFPAAPAASGKRQSPIDIKTDQCEFDPALFKAEFFFNYHPHDCRQLTNTGSTWKVSAAHNAKSCRHVGM